MLRMVGNKKGYRSEVHLGQSCNSLSTDGLISGGNVQSWKEGVDLRRKNSLYFQYCWIWLPDLWLEWNSEFQKGNLVRRYAVVFEHAVSEVTAKYCNKIMDNSWSLLVVFYVAGAVQSALH